MNTNTFDVEYRFGKWMVVEYFGMSGHEAYHHTKDANGRPVATQAEAEALWAQLREAAR